MLSMTGYGRAEYNQNGIEITVEIKTVNNRNFDFNAKMPRSFVMYEDSIRKTVAKYVSRARVDLFLNFTDHRENVNSVSVNVEKAMEYFKAAEIISRETGAPLDVSASTILRLPDVIEDSAVQDLSDLKDVISSVVENACIALNQMRKIEGEKLVADMLSRMDTIRALREQIVLRAPLVATDYKDKLTARIKDALKDVNYDETRLLNEVAFYTDRVNVDEELTRLSSHINQFCEIIKTENAGKKLDFLMQEFNRETNTVCSKSNDIAVTQCALSLKNEIEKVREQVQNIE